MRQAKGAHHVKKVYAEALATLRAKGLKVQPPKLQHPDGSFTVAGLMFSYFASNVGQVKTKTDLVRFLRDMKCETHDPQPRHLGAQAGFQFLVRGCFHPELRRTLRPGEYCLLSLDSAHPNHHTQHRECSLTARGFDQLKKRYKCRCAVCGSQEGAPHFKNTHLVTTLERGHRDPRRPLTLANCLPMCTMCNQVYRDFAVFNHRGFVVDWLKRPPARALPRQQKIKADGDPGPPATPGKKGVRVKQPRRPVRLAAAPGRSPERNNNNTTAHAGPITRSRARAMHACP